jgi:hypothetical protein
MTSSSTRDQRAGMLRRMLPRAIAGPVDKIVLLRVHPAFRNVTTKV